MFRTQLTILLLLAFTSTFFGQNADCDPDSPLIRYRSRNFFNSNQVIQDVVYRDGDVGEQAMDIYLPPNSDTETNRPLVMWAHPGGFLNGSKDSDSAELWCETLAKMGFVCASIDYRKDIFGDALNPFTPAIRAPYKGIQDGRSAVRYLKANAATYGINPNDIYFAGSSAGAIIAVNVAYMSDAERPPETFGNFFRSDLGCIDCGSGALEGNNTFNGDVEATIMMWGGVADTTDIDGLTGTQTDDEPCLLLHGELDETVSPAVAPPFQDDPFFAVLAGLLFPDIFGTYPMRERLTNLGSNAPNWEARVLCGEGHTFWLDKTVEDSGNGDFGSTGLPDENFDYIVNESVDFLARARDFNLSKTNEISTLVTNTTNLDDCDSESIGTYASTAFNEYFILNPTAGHTYCWDITKGTILEGQGTDRIKVRWDSTDVAINRTGTILCYESDTNGNIFEASTHLLTIQDNDVTSPDASFMASNTGTFNEFDFTNTSSNANTSEWEFGDGNGSTLES
ncbi:MAG: alpha/beta hydrolase, partial [Bacteroidota bacterium]